MLKSHPTRTTEGILFEEQLLLAITRNLGTAGRNPPLFSAKPSNDFEIRAVCDWSLVPQQPGKEKWVCRSKELHQVRRSLSPQGSWWRERPPWPLGTGRVTTSAWFKIKQCWPAYKHVEKYNHGGETQVRG